jgi:Holliday junction resolvasome RuvABC endonuclease subunit
MITLGLDPSLTGFGWCVHNSAVVGPARILARGHWSTPSHDVFVSRYIETRTLLCELLDRFPLVEGVAVESPPFGELWSEGLYGLFLYVNEALYSRRKDVVFFDPKTLKSLTKMDPSVVKGRMDKAEMVAFAMADAGLTKPINHNEADAYHLARFAARFWEFQTGVLVEADLTPSELNTFARTHTYKRGKHAGETSRRGTVYRENDRFFRYSLLGEQDGQERSSL